ncbi:MAG: glutamine-hydrolyzing carbamoyl-phosphate synthase small subunit [Clostridiaceae bacterium]|nr:glutamine-hydrolyzing carbamoyl-phosphate synthase small subunit [Clostridiaceae bacterium]
MQAVLVLEDGNMYYGTSFGATGETIGEVVFNTCMTGYQEILTDPSYNGQIITMTYPLIGNYGFNDFDNESDRPHARGFIVKELCDTPSNWRCTIKPEDYFKMHNIIGIKDIDTRSLTQHIRNFGSMYGAISTQCDKRDVLMEKIHEYKNKKRNLVDEVSTKEMYHLPGTGKKVAVIDFGIKHNILRSLKKHNCDLYVFPHTASPQDIMAVEPNGILLSNGPGDPKDLPEAVKNIKELLGKKPIIGICLGHQLLGLCLGGDTYKLKFGHHGGNHPVKDLTTGRVYITSQNHNYALKKDLVNDIHITQINVNDNTVEAFKHKYLPVIGIQYHPEAAAGPQDTAYIFNDFVKMMEVSYNA